MTFISLTQAAHGLGIDAKTLRRWLTRADLPLLSHPHDARQKGLSLVHLRQLAEQHHRQLLPLSHEPPHPPAADLPLMSDALGEVTAQLHGLHEQVAALQQQVSALTALLTPVVAPPSPAVPPPPTRPTRPRPVPHPKKATPKPRRVPVIPWVEYDGDGGYVLTCPKQGRLSIQMESPEWFAWLASIGSFRFVGQRGHFTAHHAWQVPNGAWRAHRHLRNRNYTLRLAPTAQLTCAVLEETAATLQAHLN